MKIENLESLKSAEVGLLLNSSAAKEYPELLDLLVINKPFNPNRCDDEIRLFYKNEIKGLIYRCRKEWEIVKDKYGIYVESGTCQLCGKPKIKEWYMIRNKQNGVELKLGSHCILEYQIASTADLSQIKSEKYRALLAKEFPKLKNICEGYKNLLDNSEVVIPNSTTLLYKEYALKLILFRNDFIKQKNIKKTLELKNVVPELIEKFEIEKLKIQKYINEKKDKTLINRSIYNWMKRQHDEDIKLAIQDVENFGDIKQNNLWRVACPELIRKLAPQLNQKFKDLGIKFVAHRQEIGAHLVQYKLEKEAGVKISIYIPHKLLYQDIDVFDFLIGDSKFDRSAFVQNILSLVTVQRESYDRLIGLAYNKSVGSLVISPQWVTGFEEQHEVIISENKLYARVSETVIVQNFFQLLIGNIDEHVFVKKIKEHINKWYTKEEIKELMDIHNMIK